MVLHRIARQQLARVVIGRWRPSRVHVSVGKLILDTTLKGLARLVVPNAPLLMHVPEEMSARTRSQHLLEKRLRSAPLQATQFAVIHDSIGRSMRQQNVNMFRDLAKPMAHGSTIARSSGFMPRDPRRTKNTQTKHLNKLMFQHCRVWYQFLIESWIMHVLVLVIAEDHEPVWISSAQLPEPRIEVRKLFWCSLIRKVTCMDEQVSFRHGIRIFNLSVKSMCVAHVQNAHRLVPKLSLWSQ
mmetsp:Transcript_41062/g.113107  ORF Transcript_41062/g.113107 Transcript_41062/m.113107 type:complete len:241 (-) Transcript_41062:106-828(-)